MNKGLLKTIGLALVVQQTIYWSAWAIGGFTLATLTIIITTPLSFYIGLNTHKWFGW